MPVKERKRIPVELVRKELGAARYDRFIAKYFSKASPTGVTPLKIERETFTNLLAFLEGRTGDLKANASKQAVPPIFRLYMAEIPFVKQRMKKWVKAKVEALDAGNDLPGVDIKVRNPRIAGPRKKRRGRAA